MAASGSGPTEPGAGDGQDGAARPDSNLAAPGAVGQGNGDQPIAQEGEDFRLFTIFAFEEDNASYLVRKTGANGTPPPAEVARSGITPSGPDVNLHPVEHVLNQHEGGPTPYSSASTKPLGSPGIAGEPVWIDVNKLKGNAVYTYEEIVKMSKEFLGRNPYLKTRFEIWKSAQPEEGEALIKGEIGPGAIYTRNAVRLRSVVAAGGKVLFYVAVAQDTYAFFVAESKAREVARIAGGWTGAWAGGTAGAAGGAKVGAGIAFGLGMAGPQAAAPEEVVTVPVGAGVGGFFGGLFGTIAGYWAGSQAGKNYYDFVQQELKRLK